MRTVLKVDGNQNVFLKLGKNKDIFNDYSVKVKNCRI